jgi:hypothetical protein
VERNALFQVQTAPRPEVALAGSGDGAHNDLRISMYPDRNERTTDTNTNHQCSSSGQLVSATGIAPRQRSGGHDEGLPTRKRDLAAMSVAAQGKVEPVLSDVE